MAKTTTCCFCGKEVTKGFFKGTAENLNVGEFISLTCCDECYAKYKVRMFESAGKHFETKVNNIKKTTKRKLSEKEIADMMLVYLQEEKAQQAKAAGQEATFIKGWYVYNEDGYFAVNEYEKGFLQSDISAKQMVKSLSSTELLVFNTMFTKEDITKIEFCCSGIGDPLGVFTVAYSFNIRLNDESVMTYKPCVTRCAVLGTAFPGFWKRSAVKKMYKELENFKKMIGSDLPVVKVKKF